VCACLSLGVLIPVIGGVGGLVVISIILLVTITICCVTVHCRSKCEFSKVDITDLVASYNYFIALNQQERTVWDDTITGCQRDSTYDYIEDYQTVSCTSARKNQYLTHSVPLHPLQQPTRPESPYQAMNSVKPGCPSALKSLPLNSDVSDSGDPQALNKDMHVTPGGSVVYRSRVSGSSTGEGDYTAMQSPTRSSVILPENALPYNGQPSGEYRFTEC